MSKSEIKNKGKKEKIDRKKFIKAGLSAIGGIGLLSLLKKESSACGGCMPGCADQCLRCQSGGANQEQK